MLLVLLAVGGTVYFLTRAVQMHSGYRAMGQLETKRVEMEAARARENRVGLRDRVWAQAQALGYDGEVFPFAAAMAFLYLAVSLGLTMAKVPSVLAYLAGLPVSVAVVLAAARWSASKRRRRFNEQLVDMLELVASQIDGGTGPQRALQVVVPTMAEPLRSEMTRALDDQVATKNLITAMQELAQRYPSRAFSLFISALEIDQAAGHSIAPAIRQAAALLNADFQLRSEAVAEVAQQRGEFFIILAVVAALAGYMIFGGDEQNVDAYTSPIGLIALSAGFANVIWGVWRMLTMLRKLQGDEQL